MKILRKIRKNVKALSPVVASIILIAVTVAVSIAVAAWMGALTVGFMGSSSVTITTVDFEGVSAAANNYINVTLKNTGTKQVTISQVKVNNAAYTFAGDTTIAAGATDQVIKISPETDAVMWTNGMPYKIDLYDSSGQVVGSYQATAPS